MSLNKPQSYYQGDRPEMIQFVPVDSKRILDVGCGEGSFANKLNRVDREVWGIEPNVNSALQAQEKLFKVFGGTIEEHFDDLPENYFDLIIFNDVLEHLIDPWRVLSDVSSKISAGGSILASIPNLRFAKIMFNLLVIKDFQYTEFGVLDSTHLRFFTEKGIARLFEENGYVIERMQGLDRTPSWRSWTFIKYMQFITFSRCDDMFFTGYCVSAKKRETR